MKSEVVHPLRWSGCRLSGIGQLHAKVADAAKREIGECRNVRSHRFEDVLDRVEPIAAADRGDEIAEISQSSRATPGGCTLCSAAEPPVKLIH